MTNSKPVTKSELLSALKGFRGVVRKDMRDIVHEELTEFNANMTVPAIKKLGKEIRGEIAEFRKETKSEFKQVNSKLSSLESEVLWIKDDIKGLTEELAVTATKSEVNRLRQQINLSA